MLLMIFSDYSGNDNSKKEEIKVDEIKENNNINDYNNIIKVEVLI